MLWVGYCIQSMETVLTTGPRLPVWFPLWLLLLRVLCWLLFFSQLLKGWCSPGMPPEPDLLILHFLSLGDFIHFQHFTLHSSAHSSILTYREQHTAIRPRFRLISQAWLGTPPVYARWWGCVKGIRESWSVKHLTAVEVYPWGSCHHLPCMEGMPVAPGNQRWHRVGVFPIQWSCCHMAPRMPVVLFHWNILGQGSAG